MEIVNWLESQKLDYSFVEEKIFKIDDDYYLALDPAEKIISEDFTILLSEQELDVLDSTQLPVNKVAFLFGENWYWTSVDGDTKLNPLRHIGLAKVNDHYPEYYPFLGVHGKFELLNGNRDYKDWCKKAKFLGITALGIAEAQTLAGTMLFQEICQSEGIKSILGQTSFVKYKEGFYWAKFFVKNKIGWRNLLKINKAQLVDNWEDKFVDEDFLMKHSEGLVAILNPSVELKPWLVNKYQKHFEDVYFQIDLTEWEGASKDIEWLNNIQTYLSKFLDVLKPVRFDDAYYLDSIDAPVKKALNQIGKVNNQHLSSNQHFKDLDELVETECSLFPPSEKAGQVMNAAIRNTCEITELCDYQIPTKNRYLPKYEFNEEEAKIYSTTEDLFWAKIEAGFQRKISGQVEDESIYWERINKEYDVISRGKIIDYFLILSDISSFCDKEGILRGHGRGSSAGSLISYLLNIVEADPIKYNLLFERFLDEARLVSELPDIDADYSDRDKVKRYMEEKYGLNYVASIGTYGNLKIKNAIKDFGRILGVSPSDANFITAIINKDYESGDFTKFLELCTKEHKIMFFLRKNSKVFKYLDICLHQTRTASIHACATIIVPKLDEDGVKVDIHDFIPTKIIDGQLVTEWEGKQIEKAGFLKEDILGLKQLEKFDRIIKLIKQNENVDINIYDIPLDDKKVYDLFAEGLTEDVFQFGTEGLKVFSKELKPDHIGDIAAGNALYRPGAMESHAHHDYVKIKFGLKEPEYDYLLEDVTKSTYGLYIYQEQIMAAFQKIANTTLQEANMFRKVITKLKSGVQSDENFKKYKAIFVDNYLEKGQTPELAEKIWDKLVAFSKYGFNLSHAVCYGLIAYISQWFKANYPLEFWTASLEEAQDKDRSKRISEMQKLGAVTVRPPDINKSSTDFVSIKEDMSIYWSLSSIKFVGDKSIDYLIEERNKNGNFFSIEEFIKRCPKKFFNKRVVTNLILAGAFDLIENISKVSDRYSILEKFYKENDSLEDLDNYGSEVTNTLFWQLQQYNLTGFAHISYEKIIKDYGFDNYVPSLNDERTEQYVSVSGFVEEVKIRNSKNGQFASIMLDSNNEKIGILVWNEIFEANRDSLQDCEKKVLILNGIIKYDTYSDTNKLHTTNRTKLIVI